MVILFLNRSKVGSKSIIFQWQIVFPWSMVADAARDSWYWQSTLLSTGAVIVHRAGDKPDGGNCWTLHGPGTERVFDK